MRHELVSAGIANIDYVTLVDPETMDETVTIEGPALAAIAAHIGGTRLIDNCLI